MGHKPVPGAAVKIQRNRDPYLQLSTNRGQVIGRHGDGALVVRLDAPALQGSALGSGWVSVQTVAVAPDAVEYC